MLPGLAKEAGLHTRLVPWQDLNSAFMEAVVIEGNVMSLILSLIISSWRRSTYCFRPGDAGEGQVGADIAILRTMEASRKPSCGCS